jgi:acyl carrier protein
MLPRETLRQILLKLLEEEMGEAPSTMTDDQDLRESLGLDSVDVVGLVMRIEREFHVRLSTEELSTIKHVGDLLDLMESKIDADPVALSAANHVEDLSKGHSADIPSANHASNPDGGSA